MSRLRQTLSNIPSCTLTISLLCASLFVYHQLFLLPSIPLHKFTMNPRAIIYQKQYYRILTNSIFHSNLMHIGMNTMSFLAMGTMLEQSNGTIYLFLTILWSILFTSILYLFLAYTSYKLLSIDTWMNQHSVGFSGVLFHLTVLQCHMHSNSPSSSQGSGGAGGNGNYGDTPRHVAFGIHVPSHWYPWTLLIVLQFLIPNLSFLGHLCGILVGTAHIRRSGWCTYLFPSKQKIKSWEDHWNIVQLCHHPRGSPSYGHNHDYGQAAYAGFVPTQLDSNTNSSSITNLSLPLSSSAGYNTSTTSYNNSHRNNNNNISSTISNFGMKMVSTTHNFFRHVMDTAHRHWTHRNTTANATTTTTTTNTITPSHHFTQEESIPVLSSPSRQRDILDDLAESPDNQTIVKTQLV